MTSSWLDRKFLLLLSASLILVSFFFVQSSNAWHADGCVYCDVDQDRQIGPGDIPLENVGVNISNPVENPNFGFFNASDWTGANGCFYITMPGYTENYDETLDLTTLPGDVLFIDPVQNLHQFSLTGHTPNNERNWLVDSEICRSQGIGCRVTGGGNDTSGLAVDGSYDGTVAEGKHKLSNGGFNRYTFGGQAGANTGSQPQPKGEWTHHQQSGADGSFVFHAGTASAPPGTEIDIIVCSDEGWCNPARQAPTKQIDFAGIGTFKNIKNPSGNLTGVVPGETYHWFEVHIEDLGEPGNEPRGVDKKNMICNNGGSGTEAFMNPPVFLPADCGCADFYRIRIYQAFNPAAGESPYKDNVIYEVSGYIDGGNFQIHPPTGFDTR